MITWQPCIEDKIENKVLIEVGASYRLADTVAAHDDLAISAEKAIDNCRVVYHV